MFMQALQSFLEHAGHSKCCRMSRVAFSYHGQGSTHPQLGDSCLVWQLTQQARHCQQSSASHSHLQAASNSISLMWVSALLHDPHALLRTLQITVV